MEQLDIAFKKAFEDLPDTKDYAGVIRLLRQGASAKLLEHYELGNYNLAMLINDLRRITDQDDLEAAAELIRLAIVSGTDLDLQKEYVGNGGAVAIEMLCFNLARGLTEMTLEQFSCYYKLFPVVAAHSQRNAFETYLSYLSRSPEIAEMQEKLIIQMKEIGWKLPPDPGTYLFRRLAEMDAVILFMLDYDGLNKEGVQQLLNSFTSTNKSRKLFRMHATKPMVKTIMDILPDAVYKLIKRNEQDMLVPFLKHFRNEIAAQPALLQEAVTARGVVEKTAQLFRQAGLISTITRK